MKQIYISIPYAGHEAEMPERSRIAHKRYDSEGRVFTPRDVVKDSATPYTAAIGKCIEKMLECNEVIFADGWADSKDCRLEHEACVIYDIPYKTDPKI